MRSLMKRFLVVCALGILLGSMAQGYYHFVHFRTLGPPYVPVPEKFDLDSLVDGTVRYYMAFEGPEQLEANDSLEGLLSQFRAAANVWNGVSTSRLRLEFGGFIESDTVQNAAGIDILFEAPPGVIAQAGTTVGESPEFVQRGDDVFARVERGLLLVNPDLSGDRSSSDGFFMTLVHEFGHALGLQHTFTSSVMSTSYTRATTKANPLGADDIAGISLLYPAAGFAQATGMIRGRVVLDDSGVNLASVVALSPQGQALSTLTNPDGTYEIRGVPPGQYYVYVHPLPPAVDNQVSRADVRMPVDADGNSIPAADYFDTKFYPGVKDVNSASTVSVKAAGAVDSIDFFVARRGVPRLHSITTYTFPGSVAVPSAHLSLDATRRFLVAYGFGLTADSHPAIGLTASVIGGSAAVPANGLLPYSPAPAQFVQINVDFNPFSGVGARHLVFRLGDDLYILPSGFQITQNRPPTISSVGTTVDQDGEEVAIVVGERITAKSRIMFDGVAGEVIGEIEPGQLLVRPPAAPSQYHATVVALNPDGQTSWFLDGRTPPVYEYGAREDASFSINPNVLNAGTEAMVEIHGVNTGFQPNGMALGLGSSDVVVRDHVVLAPDLILANVAVAANTAPQTVPATMVTGLDVVRQRRILRIAELDPQEPSMHAPLRDLASRKVVAYIGRQARLDVTGPIEGLAPEQVALTLNDVPAPVTEIVDGSLVFTVPAELNPGPVVARLNVAGRDANPLLLHVALAPPEVLGYVVESAAPVATDGKTVKPGDTMLVQVKGLGPDAAEMDLNRLRMKVAGFSHEVTSVAPFDASRDLWMVRFFLGSNVPTGKQPLTITLDGRQSDPIQIEIVAP